MTKGEREEKDSLMQKRRKVIFSDTDTLSSFLWRDAFGYFLKLFQNLEIEIIIPQTVLEELEYSFRTKERLAKPLKQLEKQKKLKIQDIESGTQEYHTYLYLTEEEDLGRGEASALSMATHSEHIACVASNNLSDVWEYAKEHGIELWTTARIIRECELKQIMKQDRAEELWKKMWEDGLKLPCEKYKDYVENNS